MSLDVGGERDRITKAGNCFRPATVEGRNRRPAPDLAGDSGSATGARAIQCGECLARSRWILSPECATKHRTHRLGVIWLNFGCSLGLGIGSLDVALDERTLSAQLQHETAE